MTLGTRSLLYGRHQFLLHPLFVTAAWWKLYGLPPFTVVVAIFLHDLGLWGCEKMDDEHGEWHPARSARWLRKLGWYAEANEVLYHSRFLSRQLKERPSKLCWADKLGTAMYPVWLWTFLASLSGELAEYIADAKYEIFKPGERDGAACFLHYRAEVQKWLKAEGLTA